MLHLKDCITHVIIIIGKIGLLGHCLFLNMLSELTRSLLVWS
jgi:hypothetical protein